MFNLFLLTNQRFPFITGKIYVKILIYYGVDYTPIGLVYDI